MRDKGQKSVSGLTNCYLAIFLLWLCFSSIIVIRVHLIPGVAFLVLCREDPVQVGGGGSEAMNSSDIRGPSEMLCLGTRFSIQRSGLR